MKCLRCSFFFVWKFSCGNFRNEPAWSAWKLSIDVIFLIMGSKWNCWLKAFWRETAVLNTSNASISFSSKKAPVNQKICTNNKSTRRENITKRNQRQHVVHASNLVVDSIHVWFTNNCHLMKIAAMMWNVSVRRTTNVNIMFFGAQHSTTFDRVWLIYFVKWLTNKTLFLSWRNELDNERTIFSHFFPSFLTQIKTLKIREFSPNFITFWACNVVIIENINTKAPKFILFVVQQLRKG